MFLRPGHDLSSSLSPDKAKSEKLFIAVFGGTRLHRWSCIVVRHGGRAHRDVFCSLFPWFAALFFSSLGVSFDPISLVSLG